MDTRETSQPPERAERSMSTVRRAMAVLGVLGDAATDLGTNEIARRVGTNASTISRLLATLAEDGFVQRSPDSGRYRLGFRLVQLGDAALARVDLRELARPLLLELKERSGETATLSVPGERGTTTVDFVQSSSSVRSVAEMGRPSVPHATAVGKVYLAHGGTTPPGPLTRYTDATITERAQLRRELELVRARGWAASLGEREVDLNTIAAPVLDGTGGLRAVLAVQGPAGRFDEAAMHGVLDQLQRCANALSAQLTTGA